MIKRVVLPIPIICFYEGRVLTFTIKVYEVSLLRSGKPSKVWGQNINNPQEQVVPYYFEYLDWESKETILKTLEQMKHVNS